MKEVIPKELVTLYGTMAISRIATVQTNAKLDAMPDVLEMLKKVSNDKTPIKKISINDLDVENGGMDDEFDDFMRAGFEQLIPGFGRLRPRPFPVPTLPPGVILCGKILRGLSQVRDERAVQQQAADDLSKIIDAFSKTAHPLIILFAALFKAALKEVQERLEELDRLIAGLIRSAILNNCL